MANTQEEPESAESFNESNIDILPQPDDRFTIKNLIYPSNTEPSPLSGFAVSICTSVLGETYTKPREKLDESAITFYLVIDSPLFTVLFFPPGVLVCVFSVVAVHGGLASWSVSVLSTIMVVCLILTLIVWRQPQSKTKLAFKVCVVSHSSTAIHTIINILSECDKRDV